MTFTLKHYILVAEQDFPSEEAATIARQKLKRQEISTNLFVITRNEKQREHGCAPSIE